MFDLKNDVKKWKPESIKGIFLYCAICNEIKTSLTRELIRSLACIAFLYKFIIIGKTIWYICIFWYMLVGKSINCKNDSQVGALGIMTRQKPIFSITKQFTQTIIYIGTLYLLFVSFHLNETLLSKKSSPVLLLF